MVRYPLLLTAILAACGQEPDAEPAASPEVEPSAQNSATIESSVSPPATVTRARRALVADRLILAEWSQAENKAVCAPVSFTSDGGKGATPRRANFSGGWAVAFDLPGMRSAYGVAGTGLIPDDDRPEAERRAGLIDQWPSFRDLPALPQPAYAGYGVEGGTAWPADDPQSLKTNALAYVRIGGQACQYNVWSRLGRTHLELLLDNLRVIGRVLR
jgi:hypothetical protein